jgi:hypothetical protein
MKQQVNGLRDYIKMEITLQGNDPYPNDKLDIKVNKKWIVLSPTIDGAGNDFKILREDLKRLIK